MVVVEQRAAEKRAIEGKLAERQRQAELRRQARLEFERQRRLVEAQRRAREAADQAQTAAATASSGEDGDGACGVSTLNRLHTTPADASKGARVVAIVMQYLEIPYKWGGTLPSTDFDCSGLTMYVVAQVGVSLPHYAAAQYQLGVAVSKDQLEPGDLVFFRSLGHMGMYIGGGNFIHAPHTGDVVKTSSLSDSYYVANWVGARRLL